MAFPTIPTTAAGRLLTGVQADTTATRTFPNLTGLTKDAGDLLIAVVYAYQSSVASNAFSGWTAGWTEFADFSTTTGMAIGAAYKGSTGAETGTISVTQAATITGHAVMVVMSIPGAHPTTPPEAGSFASGTTAAADPAAFDPTGWAAEDTLWIAAAGTGETATTGSYTGTGSAPTSYTNFAATAISADVVGGVDGAVAFRQLNAASENVGPFGVDTSNARNSALVIAVRPDPAARLIGASANTSAGAGLISGPGPTRQFDHTAFHFLTTSIGGMTGVAGGARTFAAIVRRTALHASQSALVMAVRDAGALNISALALGGTSNTGQIALRDGNTDTFTGVQVNIADGWCVVAVTKAAGTVAPRGHKVPFSGAAPTHANAAGTIADRADVLADGVIGDGYSGGVAVVGVWASALSDAQIEGLAANLQAWVALSPVALWRFNQATVSTVNDLIDGANQTGINGTTVATEGPLGFDFSLAAPVALAGVSNDSTAGTGDLVMLLAGASANTSAGAGNLLATFQVGGISTSTTAGSGTLAVGSGVLAGNGLSTSAGTGVLGVGRAIAGIGNNSTAGSGTLTLTTMATVEVGAIRWTVLAGALAGTSTSASSGQGVLFRAVALAGASTNTSTGPSLLAAAVPLVGQSADTSAGSGTISTGAVFAGQSANISAGSGFLALARPLAGVGTNTTAGAGSLALAVPVSGQSASSTVGTGILALAVPVSGQPSVNTSAGAGTLALIRPLAGASANSSAGTGTLLLAVSLGGASANTASGTGLLFAAVPVSGQPSVNTSAGSGNLTGTGAASGASLNTSAGSGSLNLAAPIPGASLNISAGTGALTLGLRAASLNTSTGAGTLQVRVAGAGNVTSTGTGALGVAAPLTGQSADASAGSGTLALAVRFSGASANGSDGAGLLGLAVPLAGQPSLVLSSGSGTLLTFVGIVPQWRGRLTVVARGPSRAAGGGPAHVISSGPTGVRGG